MLISEASEKVISKERMAELNAILISDADARLYYQEYVLNNVILSTLYGNAKSHFDPHRTESEQTNMDCLIKLAELESMAPEVEIYKETPITFKPEIKESKPKKKSKFFIFFDKIVYAAAILLIMFIAYAELFTPDHALPVATVVDQMGVSWNRSSQQLANNDRIMSKQPPYSIKGGILKIKFDQGVDVIIEGPAEFVFERNGLFVESGKIYSLVSSSGKGFTVDTANARFIDLGTEFGLNIFKTGTSELHVLTGKVQLFAGEEKADKVSQLVTANEAIKFEAANGQVVSIPISSEHFVRDIDSTKDIVWYGQKVIDLADYVGGGNGFGTGEIDHGISYETASVSLETLFVKDFNLHPKVQTEFFKKVTQIPAIDGIFVPDGSNENVIVSSAGDIFKECPDTNSCYCVPIINGGRYDMIYDEQMMIGDKPYGTKDNPSLFMHANIGITFDLDQIRKQIPETMTLASFTSIASSPDNPENVKRNLDVWILLDGKLSYFKKDIYTSEPFDINVDITDDNHYLSLVVTQGSYIPGESLVDSWDWLLLGTPELNIKAK